MYHPSEPESFQTKPNMWDSSSPSLEWWEAAGEGDSDKRLNVSQPKEVLAAFLTAESQRPRLQGVREDWSLWLLDLLARPGPVHSDINNEAKLVCTARLQGREA